MRITTTAIEAHDSYSKLPTIIPNGVTMTVLETGGTWATVREESAPCRTLVVECRLLTRWTEGVKVWHGK